MTTTALRSLPHPGHEPILSERTPLRSLTPREKQVLDLIASGLTAKEVAYELGNSHATVRVLRARAMAKLGRSKRNLALCSE
jgi:DNA-binding NarL/FixJ family response regulator